MGLWVKVRVKDKEWTWQLPASSSWSIVVGPVPVMWAVGRRLDLGWGRDGGAIFSSVALGWVEEEEGKTLLGGRKGTGGSGEVTRSIVGLAILEELGQVGTVEDRGGGRGGCSEAPEHQTP